MKRVYLKSFASGRRSRDEVKAFLHTYPEARIHGIDVEGCPEWCAEAFDDMTYVKNIAPDVVWEHGSPQYINEHPENRQAYAWTIQHLMEEYLADGYD